MQNYANKGKNEEGLEKVFLLNHAHTSEKIETACSLLGVCLKNTIHQ